MDMPASLFGLLLGAMCQAGCLAYTPPAQVEVPEAYMPAPGYCRVWTPGKPAAEQEPALPCRDARAEPASGETLIVGAPEPVEAP
jgi:hypothetical protein